MLTSPAIERRKLFSMSLEVGTIVEGKVTGITKFGAFVELEGGKTGMVHISEVAPTYVNDIKDHLKEGQTVKVKILSVSEEGKISLSIKKAQPPQNQGGRGYRNPSAPRQNNSAHYEWHPPKQTEPSSFEDMLSRFKQTSDEKISNLKRANESRRGGSRRGNFQK